MALIKSISGFRGTIGGNVGENLTPIDIVSLTSAYAQWIKEKIPNKKSLIVVVGRDARISGNMVSTLVIGTLTGCGINVVDIGLATTPTTEIAVILENADGGIIITASHNPKEWNALKLLDNKGEFLSAKDGKDLLKIAEKAEYSFATINNLGAITHNKNITYNHIQMVLKNKYVDVDAIKRAKFKVVVDGINSVGGIAIPSLLNNLDVKCIEINCEPSGIFAHNPEPIPENLTEISKIVVAEKADLGIVVDPDVDRLAFICENGEMFGEEYTLVSIADYVLSKTKGNTSSNLSSSRALRDITKIYGGKYEAAAVGEVNVVAKMKEINAVIGGEGNGGIILPDLHYGRDALIGTAMFLTNLANKKIKVSELRATYPNYFMSKNKIDLDPQINIDDIFNNIKNKYFHKRITDIDGVKIDFDDEKMWVHLRKSNTEPIIRIYSEATTPENAQNLANKIITEIKKMIRKNI